MKPGEIEALARWRSEYDCNPQAVFCRWSRRFDAYQVFDSDRRWIGCVGTDGQCSEPVL